MKRINILLILIITILILNCGFSKGKESIDLTKNGNLELDHKRFNEAKQLFEEAIELNSENREAQYGLYMVHKNRLNNYKNKKEINEFEAVWDDFNEIFFYDSEIRSEMERLLDEFCGFTIKQVMKVGYKDLDYKIYYIVLKNCGSSGELLYLQLTALFQLMSISEKNRGLDRNKSVLVMDFVKQEIDLIRKDITISDDLSMIMISRDTEVILKKILSRKFVDSENAIKLIESISKPSPALRILDKKIYDRFLEETASYKDLDSVQEFKKILALLILNQRYNSLIGI